MDLKTRKLKAIGYLINLQDGIILNKIEAAISEGQRQQEKTADLKPFTQKQLIARAKRSDKDYLDGNFKSQEQLENESENW
jgi:hypothetical protein